MAAKLRVARLDSRGYSPASDADLYARHSELMALIRRYLPNITTSLFAEPRPLDDGHTWEWYSELQGQPEALADLPEQEQQEIRELLASRLNSVRELADRLQAVEPDTVALQAPLLAALQYPGEQAVYVVEGQPVLTFWGYQPLDEDLFAGNLPAEMPPVSPAVADKPGSITPVPAESVPGTEATGRRRRWPWWLLLLVLLAGALFWFWNDLPFRKWFEPDYWAMYQQATGDCERIRALEQALSAEDIQFTDALPAVRQAVAKERLACDTPDYWAMYQAATGDCDRIRELEKQLSQPDLIKAPELPAVRQAVIKERQQCDLPDYRAMYEEAKGDCQRIAELYAYLQQPEREVTPELPEVLAMAKADHAQCRLAYYQQLLEQAGEDCDRLAAIADQMAAIQSDSHAGLQAVFAEYLARQASCRLADLQEDFEAARQDCARLRGFAASLKDSALQDEGFRQLQQDIATGLAECNRPKPVAKPEPEPEPQPEKLPVKKTEVDPRQLCPGERPKELAPDLAIVFDASNSMNQSMTMGNLGNLNIGGVLGLGLGIMQSMSEKRIDVAKKAAFDVVSSLPQDVDAGLVLLNECPRATKEGFYSPQQRQILLQRINRIRTVGGTPLASGILQASEMVDGVNAPAVMVVISDGSESCKGDPCATAQRIARSKPLLKINVVDIMGTGAANCIARATGGRVFTANNAGELHQMLNTAVEEVKGPANCIRR